MAVEVLIALLGDFESLATLRPVLYVIRGASVIARVLLEGQFCTLSVAYACPVCPRPAASKLQLEASDSECLVEQEVLVEDRRVGEQRARVAARLILARRRIDVAQGLNCVIRDRGQTDRKSDSVACCVDRHVRETRRASSVYEGVAETYAPR